MQSFTTFRKEIDWICLGKTGNAGDALLFEVSEQLLSKYFNLHYHCAQHMTIDQFISDKIIIGPGAIISGTFTGRFFQKFFRLNSEYFFGNKIADDGLNKIIDENEGGGEKILFIFMRY